MLTRIEISGFKTFDAFELDMPPFLAVIGPNASGKSNFFDALQFLQRATQSSLTTAVQQARGDVGDLFRRRGDGTSVDVISMAVEVLLAPRVRDPWGTEVELTQTRLRYELTVEKRADDEGNVRLFVTHEEVVPLRRSHDRWRDSTKPSAEFIETFIKDGRRRQAFLETVGEGRGRAFQTRQDGVQGRARPAEAAEATVLSSMNSADFRHLYALREEIVNWRFLQLDPIALRLPGEKYDEERLTPSGSNLARVLHRIQAETTTPEQPKGRLADISTDLASLIDSVRGIEVRENEQTRRWEIVVHGVDDGRYLATVASDGTLRILALLAALYDPKYHGLVCFEEPENGVHPLRLRTLIRYLRDLTIDPGSADLDDAEGLTPVLGNRHSPGVLSALDESPIAVMDSSTRIEPSPSGRVRSRVTRVRKVSRDAEATRGLDLHEITAPQEIHRYEAAALLEQAP